MALIEFLAADESLKNKVGLSPLLSALGAFTQEAWSIGDVEAMVDAFGHCKVQKSFDKDVVKLQFVGPHVLQCGETLTTLGSVTSRLLRSVNVPRKNGTAPMGHMERQLQQVLQTRKAGQTRR